jgi:hypothetical protein
MSMQGRTNTAATPRRRTPRGASISARQRRLALIEIIAAGLERAVAERTCAADGDTLGPEDSGVDGLELSATSRLSVHTGRKPGRNASKAGERA